MPFVTIETKDGRQFNGVLVEGWQSYQEALDDETSSRNVKKAKVDKVWHNGNKLYDSKNPYGKYCEQADYY